MSIGESNLWRIAACLVVIVGLSTAVFQMPTCSKSSVSDLTWDLELLRSEQESSQSMIYLVDSIFEWENIADDFSMHDDWTARKGRINNRLAELSISIQDRQTQLDECNQKGD